METCTNVRARRERLSIAKVMSEMLADGISAAAEKDFGMSWWAALLTGYLNLAATRKGEYFLLAFVRPSARSAF